MNHDHLQMLEQELETAIASEVRRIASARVSTTYKGYRNRILWE